MAAYPTFGQLTQSRESWTDDVQTERASNGTLRGRALWSAPKLALQLQHLCSRAEAETLLALHAANRATPVDVVWDGDGQTYSMVFVEPPRAEPVGGLLWRVTSKLEQV